MCKNTKFPWNSSNRKIIIKKFESFQIVSLKKYENLRMFKSQKFENQRILKVKRLKISEFFKG